MTSMTILLRLYSVLKGAGPFWGHAISYVIMAIIMLIFVAIALVGMIYLFRKYMARLQRRIGPNRVGKFGIFQLIADALKLVGKENIFPGGRDDLPYKIAPMFVIFGLFAAFTVLPYGFFPYFGNITVTNSSVSIILLFAFIAIMPIGEVLAGVSSRNKYALIGALRAVAKDVSFEVPMMLSVIALVMMASARTANGLNLEDLTSVQFIPYGIPEVIGLFVFFIAMIARAAYSPFDLGESDSELVSGYSTEYSGMRFGMFYMGLFGSIFLGSMLVSVLYLGGYNGPFSSYAGFIYLLIKTFILVLVAFLVWLSIPRIRIDKFVNMGWKYLLPIAVINLIISGVLTLGLGI